MRPQPPQWRASRSVSVHTPLQGAKPGVHITPASAGGDTQTPLAQVEPIGQVLPQPPQW